jgi:hypothetical protein
MSVAPTVVQSPRFQCQIKVVAWANDWLSPTSKEEGRKSVLTFDDSFHSDGVNGCVIWANETKLRRVRFNVGPDVLREVLHAGNPVHDNANVALCERERSRIEAACRSAFANRPSASVDLRPVDFPEIDSDAT